jgi:hypothetical protein
MSQVLNTLESARTLAIKEHRPILLAFTVKTKRAGNGFSNGMYTDAVMSQWTRIIVARLRDELVNSDPTQTTPTSSSEYVDMFEPHPGVAPIDLPEGIKVAAPQMDFQRRDAVWITQPTFRDTNTVFTDMEYASLIAVLFSPDGTVLTKLPGGGTANIGNGRYVVLDLDQDGQQKPLNAAVNSSGWFTYYYEGEEPNIQLAPFIAVFNDAALRESYDINNWKGNNQPTWVSGSPCSSYGVGRTRMNCEQSEWINQFGDKIYFNRYTGRAEVLKR